MQPAEESFIHAADGFSLHALKEWLVWRAVERRKSEFHGAVFSWLRKDGSADAAYPEIAGYYLQYLCLHAEPTERRTSLLADVSAWLSRISASTLPRTLYYFDRRSDWRTEVQFCFDFAMIARGLSRASRAFPNIVDVNLGRRYFEAVVGMTTGDFLQSCPTVDGKPGVLPNKWSTRFDVHLAKAAAALLAMPWRSLDSIALATLHRLMEDEDLERHPASTNLHPFFYFIEGMLIAWAVTGDLRYLECASRTYLAELRPSHGAIRVEHLRRRHDATAQALRAGAILRAAGALEGRDWTGIRETSFEILMTAQSEEGGIYFDLRNEHQNVWTGLFACQAVEMSSQLEAGLLDARDAAAMII
jgi:hypothetical protein